MRRSALLVCLALVGITALSGLKAHASAFSADASDAPVTVRENSVRDLPAMAAMRHYPSGDDGTGPLVLDADLSQDSPLSAEIFLLAAWLPIAGCLLALALEGTVRHSQSEKARGGDTEVSLD